MGNSENKGCLFALLRIFKEKKQEEVFPYERRYILTVNELSFYKVLKNNLPAEYSVFAKVRLEDIFRVIKGTEKWQSWRGRIKSRHIDFVIMEDANPMNIILIEIDDKSHNTVKAKEADQFKNKLAAITNTRLVRIKAKKSYSAEDLKPIFNTNA
jgi:uncharacterized protein DUF2726